MSQTHVWASSEPWADHMQSTYQAGWSSILTCMTCECGGCQPGNPRSRFSITMVFARSPLFAFGELDSIEPGSPDRGISKRPAAASQEATGAKRAVAPSLAASCMCICTCPLRQHAATASARARTALLSTGFCHPCRSRVTSGERSQSICSKRAFRPARKRSCSRESRQPS